MQQGSCFIEELQLLEDYIEIGMKDRLVRTDCNGRSDQLSCGIVPANQMCEDSALVAARCLAWIYGENAKVEALLF